VGGGEGGREGDAQGDAGRELHRHVGGGDARRRDRPVSITEYQRYWNEGERQTYRLQSEFRELWPELETPNEFAQQILKQLDPSMSKQEIAMLPTRLTLTA